MKPGNRAAQSPLPPAGVLRREITKADVDAYPAFFISGPGRIIAATTDCGHGYTLVDTCPNCDANQPLKAARKEPQ